jgi:adenine-specific DNA-methyltransferase
VPHITLESIAKNAEIDAIAAKYQPQIDQALSDLNRALVGARHVDVGARHHMDVGARHAVPLQEWEVPREIPHPAWPKEAQEAYWELYQAKRNGLVGANHDSPLQTIYRLTGHVWKSLSDVPDPIPAPDWPEKAKEALRRFWEAKRAKRKEIDESIQRNAPQETLYDRPKVVRGVVRVSGPFTVEAIPVPAVEDPTQAPIPQFEEAVGADLVSAQEGRVSDRGGDYLTTMLNLLKQQGGVLFPGGKKMELENLRPLSIGYLHAEGETRQNGKTLRVAISFGPQHGPVTAYQVQEATPMAKMNGYKVLLFAGFSFDPEAQALIQKAPVPGLQVHFANVAPDVLVGDLLKTTRASQIFTVFGQPDVRVEKQKDGTTRVELRGVDIYDPLTGETQHTRGSDVAAWFLDTDYDGKTFHICQAFFPGDADAWEKLQRALKAQIDPEAFEKMRGTVSFPFEPGEHKRISVKVIDFRGNEVVRVVNLEGGKYL